MEKIVYRVILALLKYSEIILLNDTYARIIDYLDHGLAQDISGKHDMILDIAFHKVKFKTEELEMIELESRWRAWASIPSLYESYNIRDQPLYQLESQ